MNNMHHTTNEIGVLETLRVVSQDPNYTERVAAYMPPVSSAFVEKCISSHTETIIGMHKKLLFLMSPEIALLEQLAVSNWDGTALLAVPHDLDSDSKGRILGNIPRGIQVEFVDEGTYPARFRPDNGLIVFTGLIPGGHRQYIMPSCYRMASLYKVFPGERMLLSCAPRGMTTVPELGWTYTESDFFTQIIEEVHYESDYP